MPIGVGEDGSVVLTDWEWDRDQRGPAAALRLQTDIPFAAKVRGRDGELLSAAWAGSPRAYLGVSVPGFPMAGTYRTPDGVISEVFEQLAAAWDDWITHDDPYVVDGERVVVLGRYSAVNKDTGKTRQL